MVPPSSDPVRARVVVADDVETNLQTLVALLEEDGHTVLAARDGGTALDLVRRELPDLLLTDVDMPGDLSGIDLCRALKADELTRLMPVVLVTGLADRQARIDGIRAGADDFLVKPVESVMLRARVHALVRLKRFTDELDSAESILVSLAVTIEARDAYTRGHCERMAAYAERLGRRLGLPGEELTALRRGGYLHDIGKIGIPDAILLKPGGLTADEARVMRSHAAIGDSLCGNLRLLRMVRPIVRHHHERLDGSGYPDGLSGHRIPLLAQIMGVVDVYDALTTDRPYRAALSHEEAMGSLEDEVQRGWRSGELVREFAELWR